ncbi:Hypothetical predicted protein [Paramuricea clavata]|uniref:Uncharacterized protein n=1 Tax=Paramuricea clavata TaxID=317549 RepID=A0A6S7FMF5_PARCT|nr:Hypothetical predicted protein [Paramuricea clavata]
MFDEESNEEVWITQSCYSKTHCAINIDDLVTFENEKHFITAAELHKDNVCRAVTRVSDFNLAERIKDRIPNAARSSTDLAVGVWQELAGRNR